MLFRSNKLAEYATHGPEEIQTILRHSREEFFLWKRSSLDDRAQALRAIGTALQTEKYSLAGLIRAEMGKLEGEALAEIEKCAAASLYYAENISDLLGPIPVPTEAKKSYVSFEPLGPVLAIMPWNFPYWQVIRFAAPALTSGNGGLLKHASNVTGSALAIQSAIERAGFPAGLFTSLVVADHSAVNRIVEDPRVAAVTLTGSEKAGADVKATLAMIERIGTSGRWDQPVTEEEIGCADSYVTRGWPGLLAAMLLVPAWQWRNAPELEQVPTWLWGPYTRYLFTPPQGFRTPGQAEAYPRFCLQRLPELQRLAERNRGSSEIGRAHV